MEDKKKKAVGMYTGGSSIAEIMEATGVKSTQTIYRILTEAGIKKRSTGGVRKISIALDAEAAAIVEKKAPRNISAWISALIKMHG